MRYSILFSVAMVIGVCGQVRSGYSAAIPPIDVIGTYVGSETIVNHNILTGERTVLKLPITLSIYPNGNWLLQESGGGLGVSGSGNYGVAGIFLAAEQSSVYFTVVGTLKNGKLKATLHQGDLGGSNTVIDGKLTATRTN